MGAVERNGYVFEPEYSVINQKGAIHVYHSGQYVEEIQFNYVGNYPELDYIEDLIDHYCREHDI